MTEGKVKASMFIFLAIFLVLISYLTEVRVSLGHTFLDMTASGYDYYYKGEKIFNVGRMTTLKTNEDLSEITIMLPSGDKHFIDGKLVD